MLRLVVGRNHAIKILASAVNARGTVAGHILAIYDRALDCVFVMNAGLVLATD